MSAVRHVDMGDRRTAIERRPDGSILIRAAAAPLEPYPKTLIERLAHWADAAPARTFIAQRDPHNPAQWQRLSYAETWQQVRQVAAGILQKPLSTERPIAILSGNDIQHAVLALAAMMVGIPYAPISPQYSLLSKDHAKLKYVLDLITPGLVFVDNAETYAGAIAAAVAPEAEIVATSGTLAQRQVTSFADLAASTLAARAEDSHAQLKADDIAKFLFSSGSTGMPKAVINTHRMLCANQQMILQALPFLAEPPPVLVDWLPWNHTFGGNHNVGIVLYNGGTYYIDQGKPTPQGFLESVRNLKEIAPTAFYNVPKGFEELVKHLRADSQLRETFFSRLQMLFYAGAGLSQPVWDALDELAVETCGERIMIVTGLGCTETAPSALFTTGDGGFAGWLGLPVAGVEAKLVSVGSKTEIRFRGDNVTPGYWRNPELTAKAFDDEGFYCTGDAVKFVDANHVQKGLMFDGRIAEDFKLDTGTWVSAGPLRAQFLNHFGRLVKDVVIVGRDRPYVSALVFPDLEICRGLSADLQSLDDRHLCESDPVRERFQALLNTFAHSATGSASRVCTLKLLVEPPSLDKHEITDKGSLNASAIQDVRAGDIEQIYEGARDSTIISIQN